VGRKHITGANLRPDHGAGVLRISILSSPGRCGSPAPRPSPTATTTAGAESPFRPRPLPTVQVSQVSDLSRARSRDPRFHRRIRLLARLDALKEILHV